MAQTDTKDKGLDEGLPKGVHRKYVGRDEVLYEDPPDELAKASKAEAEGVPVWDIATQGPPRGTGYFVIDSNAYA